MRHTFMLRGALLSTALLLAALPVSGAPARAKTASGVSIPVTVAEPSGAARTGEGVHSGIPFTKGTVKSLDELILVDAQGMTLYYFANDIPAGGASSC